MEIIGFIASLIIGVSLGLIGGGGSILTVPVLVYLFKVEPVLATAYSLFIVGLTSLAGVVPKYNHGEVNFKTALLFGIPSMLSVFINRAYIVPAIPNEVFSLYTFVITKGMLMMLLFAVLMIVASVSMINSKSKKSEEKRSEQSFSYPMIILGGTGEGLLTGLVGAGGGFLIIPALVLLCKLPMKQAIGTSLLIIAAKSLIGFTGDLGKQEMDWTLLLTVSGLAMVGIFIGSAMSKRISPDSLKIGFGYFILVMGIYILIKEIILPVLGH